MKNHIRLQKVNNTKHFVSASFYFSVKNGSAASGLLARRFSSVASRIITVFFLTKILFFVKLKSEFSSEVLEEAKKQLEHFSYYLH